MKNDTEGGVRLFRGDHSYRATGSPPSPGDDDVRPGENSKDDKKDCKGQNFCFENRGKHLAKTDIFKPEPIAIVTHEEGQHCPRCNDDHGNKQKSLFQVHQQPPELEM